MSEYYTGTLSGKKLVGSLRASAALGVQLYPRGNDGVSPVVTVEDIPGGHRVTVTDANGVKTFPVLDGKDGLSGADPIVMEEQGAVISVSDAAERAFSGLTLYGRTVQNGTPTPEAPVSLESAGDSGSVDVTAAGNNLFDENKWVADYRINYDTGEAEFCAGFGCSDYVPAYEKTTYTLNFSYKSSAAFGMAYFDSEKSFLSGTPQVMEGSSGFGNPFTFTTPEGCAFIRFSAGTSVAPTPEQILLNIGPESLPFEAYREPRTLSVSTPNGLPGIPVSSGGNYTDENAQRWICDEKDFARGKYVQRVAVIQPTNIVNSFPGVHGFLVAMLATNAAKAANNNTVAPVMCSHLTAEAADPQYVSKVNSVSVNANGVVNVCVDGLTTAAEMKQWLADNQITIMYQLATPIETDLSEEEKAAFAQLRSFKPNTTVFNDAGAYMAVQYAADTKIYVDDRYEELAEEIMNGGGNGGGSADLTGYATEQWVQEGFQPKGNYLTKVPDGYAREEDIPTKPEDIGAQPAGNYATKEEIPSVPVQSVNGKTGAVTLTAADVKARSENWMPTAQDVGADPRGTAAAAVSEHNTGTGSHNDLRIELKALSDRLTAFFDSDDTTLDELSEIVAYITNNKTLIDSITTAKVSVSDIVNNLTTNVTNKPLSAAQGVVLNGLIGTLSNSLANCQPKGDYALRSDLPAKVSQLQNDAGYLTLGTLPVYNGEVQ